MAQVFCPLFFPSFWLERRHSALWYSGSPTTMKLNIIHSDQWNGKENTGALDSPVSLLDEKTEPLYLGKALFQVPVYVQLSESLNKWQNLLSEFDS